MPSMIYAILLMVILNKQGHPSFDRVMSSFIITKAILFWILMETIVSSQIITLKELGREIKDA